MSPLLQHNAENIFWIFQIMELIRGIGKNSSTICTEGINNQEIIALVLILILFPYRQFKGKEERFKVTELDEVKLPKIL